MLPRFGACIVPLFLTSVCVGLAYGQDFPSRALRITTGSAGGALDTVARLISPGLAGSLGQQIIVDNRGTILAPVDVSQAPPDGHTVLLFGSPFWLAPYMRSNVPFDPVKDFAPITIATTQPNVLVVHPSLGVNSVKELIALARAQPGKLNYASNSPGSTGQLASELLKSMVGVNIVEIPYKGAAQAISSTMGNETQMTIDAAGSVAQHIKSGRLKALAVTSAQPSVLLPGLPTVASAGLPGYELEALYGIFAPAKTPAPVINRLNQELVRALTRDDVKEKFLNAGIVAVGSTPAQLAAALKSEMSVFGKLIKDLGIRAE